MANGDDRIARLMGTATGALVASQLAAAILAKQKSPTAEDAVKAYNDILEELRKSTAANREAAKAES